MCPPDSDRATPTRDGHHVVIDGRRWRATDPHIPAPLRAELVAELMAARRAVGAAKRADDPAAEQRARVRVGDAKVALGERGAPWWAVADDSARADRLAATMRALLHHRKPESTICPSDAARVAGGPGWRDHMDAARGIAFELQRRGIVEVRQAGASVMSVDEAQGPTRIARGRGFPA
jgi:Protein of unknown function (DUF3253)